MTNDDTVRPDMQTYRCKDCGRPILATDARGGTIRLPCPNRQCPSRRRKPNSPPINQTIKLPQ